MELSFEICMDIFDWFDDELLDFISHILLSKSDGERRVRRALPALRAHARQLVNLNRDTPRAYPGEISA